MILIFFYTINNNTLPLEKYWFPLLVSWIWKLYKNRSLVESLNIKKINSQKINCLNYHVY